MILIVRAHFTYACKVSHTLVESNNKTTVYNRSKNQQATEVDHLTMKESGAVSVLSVTVVCDHGCLIRRV